MSANSAKEGMLFVDISRCMGCHSCEVACAVAHSESKELAAAILEEPRPSSRVTVEAAGERAVPLQCRHCEEAPCVAICPTEAVEKLGPNQPVLIRQEQCIGCKFCIMVCPFGVITMRRDGKVALKCDLCLDRLDAGDEPACVAACPSGALQFRDIDQWLAQRRREAAAQVRDAVRQADEIAGEAADAAE